MELLRQRIDQGFLDLHRRLDDLADLQTERHDQNTHNIGKLDTDLEKLTHQVTVMNGTVARNTRDIAAHALDIAKLFARPILTLANLKWTIAAFVGGVTTVVGSLAALYAVLHALKLLPGQ